MRLVDSHAHLQLGPFRDDIEEVLAAARAAGVVRILVPGVDVPTSEAALALAARFPGLDVAAGVHPHVAKDVDAGVRARIAALARREEVVAVGETGLDFDRAWSPPAVQVDNLRWNLELALELGKPAVVHCRSKPGERDAQEALLEALVAAGFGGEAAERAFGDRPGAVLHSVSGPADYVAAALGLGCAVSISGLVFRRGEEATAESVRLVPSERLLVETDAPYLAPPGGPRRRNAPEWVRITAAWVAHQRGDDPETLGAQLVANHDRIFARAAG